MIPVYLGEIANKRFYYSQLLPFVGATERNNIDRSGHYFIAFGYHSIFNKNSGYTELVRKAIRSKTAFTMCLNCPESYRSFHIRFPEQSACYVSELAHFYLRHNYGAIFNLPSPELRKKYQAVMVANRLPCKNRFAASEIPDLACVISSKFEDQEVDTPNATFINKKLLSRRDLANIYNRSQMGVILSFLEGANRATIEYLLSGLPVVSTESKGGRAVFLDRNNSYIVKKANSKGRKQFINEVNKGFHNIQTRIQSRELKPSEIRYNTLGRVHWFFENLSTVISQVVHTPISEIQKEIETVFIEHASSTEQVFRTHSIPPTEIDLDIPRTIGQIK